MDGELVVINLDTGCYYSLNESAAIIWQQLENGLTPNEVSKQVFDSNSFDLEQLSYKVDTFCRYLIDEQLMVPTNEVTPNNEASTTGVVFSNPSIEKFADMQDMLLLDPIHEVNEKGWPHEAR